MQMEEQEARLVQNILNLTEEEVRLITRFRRGEGLLCIGHNHVPISVFVSPRSMRPSQRRPRTGAPETMPDRAPKKFLLYAVKGNFYVI